MLRVCGEDALRRFLLEDALSSWGRGWVPLIRLFVFKRSHVKKQTTQAVSVLPEKIFVFMSFLLALSC